MGAFTITGSKNISTMPGMKKRLIIALGPASYDTGGSVIDLSTSGVLGAEGFTKVSGIAFVGAGTSTATIYQCHYLPDTGDAAATAKILLMEVIQATPAEESSTTDLDEVIFRFEVTGF